jgi:hypothetical protein
MMFRFSSFFLLLFLSPSFPLFSFLSAIRNPLLRARARAHERERKKKKKEKEKNTDVRRSVPHSAARTPLCILRVL